MSPHFILKKSLRQSWQAQTTLFPIPHDTSYLGAGFPPRWEKLLERKARRWLAQYQPTVIHARGAITAGIFARAIHSSSENNKVKLIYDVRGDILAEAEAGDLLTSRGAKKQKEISALKNLEKDALSIAAHVLGVSSSLIQMCRDRYGYQGSAHVIPCWAAEEILPEDDSSRMRHQLGFKDEDWIWSYAGSTSDWQCLPECLDLIRELHALDPKHKALLITDAPQHMSLLCTKHRLPTAAYTIRSGNRAQTLAWLSASDNALLLRQKHAINRVACPMKLGDYLMTGLPVLISAEIGDTSQWVHDFSAGEVCQTLNLPELTMAAQKLSAQTASLRKSLGAHAKKLFQDKFSFKNYQKTYLNIYHSNG